MPGVAGWRLKPARKGSEQQGASEGKAFPFLIAKTGPKGPVSKN